MNMMNRGQSATEYLLLLGGVIIVVAMLAFFLIPYTGEVKKTDELIFDEFASLVWSNSYGWFEAEDPDNPPIGPGRYPKIGGLSEEESELYDCWAVSGTGMWRGYAGKTYAVMHDGDHLKCYLPDDFIAGEYFLKYEAWYSTDDGAEVLLGRDDGETLRMWVETPGVGIKTIPGTDDDIQRSTDQWNGAGPSGETGSCTYKFKIPLEPGDEIHFEVLDESVWLDVWRIDEKFTGGMVCWDKGDPDYSLPDITIPEGLLIGLISLLAGYFFLRRELIIHR